jgi:serine/threonine-protein kinase
MYSRLVFSRLIGRDETAGLGEAAADVAVGVPVLSQRWKLLSEIGRGGQATVWLARDVGLDTLVAIKVFKADLTATQRERLRREVLLGRTLQHPGLVRVFELIETGDRLAVAMEWIPEGSLAQRLEAGPLAIDEVVRVAGQVLEVLAYLHEKGVVHRDVKPSNLLVDSEGRVRLADLGLARPLDDDRGLTRTMAAVGTPAYMSPEQIRGEAPAPAADLYGLGVTLYQLVTGALPFSGTSEFDVANKHLTVRVGDPRWQRRDCPAWLAGFILRLLEKAPRDRFRSAPAALAALRRRRRLVSPRGLRRAAAAVLLLAVSVAGVAAAVRHGRRPVLAGITVTGKTVTVRAASGAELWSREFPEPPDAVLADILGDAAPEVAVGTGLAGRPASDVDLLVLDDHGVQQAAWPSAAELVAPPYDAFVDRLNRPRLFALDLDRDDRPELVWSTSHQMWYPTLVGAWNPRAGMRPGAVLLHSGHVDAVVPADVDGDGAIELVVAAVNNPLGWQHAVAIVELRRNASSQYDIGVSPDLVFRWSTNLVAGSTVAAYTVLGPRGGGNRLLRAGPDGITAEVRGRPVRLDGAGNPEGSALYGRGPQLRREFWNDLAKQCQEIEAGRPAGGLPLLAARYGDVLQEAPMRLAAVLLLARSLAASGDHAGAMELLRSALAEMPDDLDLRLRLGEQLAIAGEYRAAVAELTRAAQVHTIGRSPFDAVTVWAMVASLDGDAAEIEKAVRFWLATNGEHTTGVLRVACLQSLWAFCRGAWEDASLRAAAPAPDMPYVEVARLWATLARGADPRACAEQAAVLAANPEVRELARALEARAWLVAGDTAAARARLEGVVDVLTKRARTDVLALAWLAVAHRVSGEVAEAMGERRVAAEHYRRAAHVAPRCWFGGAPKAESPGPRAAS